MKSLTPFILLGVSVGLFFLFIDPKYQDIKNLKQEISENKVLIERANQLRKERESLREEFNQISVDDRMKLEKILPDTVDNVRLILDINNIADEYGISITNIGITNEENQSEGIIDQTGESYGTLGLNFSVSSRYETFKSFMQDLESSMRLVDIHSFSVGAGEGMFYNFDVSLNTYWLR